MTEPTPEFYRTIPLSDLSKGTTRHFKVSASDNECQALGKRLGDISIATLGGHFELTLRKIKTLQEIVIIEISGIINAEITQSCVVTFDPVDAIIDGTFEGLITSPAADPTNDLPEDDGNDVENAPEPPELLGLVIDDTIDLGSILAEQLSLELDPFPRKPGISFDGYESGNLSDEDDVKPNPFAVLAKLKDNPE